MVRHEMLWVGDGKNNLSIPLLTELIQYGFQHCEYTIFEGIFNSNWYEPLFQIALQLYQSDILAYYYDLSFDETLKHHQTRDKKLEFGEKEMRRW